MIEAKKYLKFHGIKPSVQRVAIINYLQNNFIHPTADDIYNELSRNITTLSKATVYNTLKLLVKNNAVRAITIDEKNLRFDIDIKRHAHFKCKKCGCIFDVPISDDVMEFLDVKDLCVDEIQLYILGYCSNCKKYEH